MPQMIVRQGRWPLAAARVAALAASGTSAEEASPIRTSDSRSDTSGLPDRWWRQTADMTPHVENLGRLDAHGRGWGKNELNWITAR